MRINGAAFTVRGNSLAALAKDSNVAYISLDRTVWATATVTDLYDQAVLAPYAWSRNFTGSGIGVAVIDSGITAGRDFTLANGTGSRIVYNQNFASGPNTAADLYGHGTHVAGILAGNGMNSRGVNFRKTFMGIADNASLINLRVLDQNGVGRDSAVIAAIEKAISLKSKYNIRVINLSLGRAVYESYKLDPLCQAVEAAWNAGIVVVVAAGNDGRDNSFGNNGYGTIDAPGNEIVWIELTVIPLVLAVLHIFRLLDAGKGGEPEQLALHDHVLQSYGLLWLALMCIGLYT